MKKCIIYHHNDMDGRASGSIMYKALQSRFYRAGTLDQYEFAFREIGYTKNIAEDIDPDAIYAFVDYSFSRVENMNFFKEIINAGNEVIWIDHHKTSLDAISETETAVERGLAIDPNKENLKCVINIDHCATWLCYKYGVEVNGFEFSEENMPDLIKYIDSYDTWKMYMPKTVEFNDGAYVSDMRPQLWIDGILGEGCKPYAIFKPDAVQRKRMQKYVSSCINSGAVIQDYRDKMDKRAIKGRGFEFLIEDMRDMLDVKTYRGFAMNGSGNSLTFGDKIHEYDIVCPFTYNGKEWKYSFFTESDEIDVSKLCKLFGGIDGLGGGGHQKAAGFQTKDLIIHADGSIDILKSKILKQRYVIYVSSTRKTYRFNANEE